jgi:hypothetical protein
MNRAFPLGNVTYANLWEGISLTYKSAKDGITESVYHVAPKADVSKIRLKYNARVEMKKDGKLNIKFSKGYITESAPVAWQYIDGKKKPVEVAFRIKDGEVGFSVGKYDKTSPLIIDPTFDWHTFYGATASYQDNASSIAIDGSGNIYVTGKSQTRWNGPKGEPYLNTNATGALFVLKLDSSGEYQWHTFYGSGDNDSAGKIAVDSGGNVYMTGSSYNGFTGPTGQEPLKAHGYVNYGVNFILKLNSSGGYLWHTYFEPGYDCAIAFDSKDNVYVSGKSSGHSDDFPITPLYYGGNIIIFKLNGLGAFQWITFYGYVPNNIDTPGGIVIDGSDNIYVTGTTYGSWTGPLGDTQPPLHAFSGSAGDYGDIFVLRLRSDGSYVWHTFYGSSSYDYAGGLAVDTGGNIYATGYSYETWNGPVTGNTPLNEHSGSSNDDIFMLKLSSSGAYRWHTFYGSSSDDQGESIAVDTGDNVYLTGYSSATWNGPNSETPLNGHSGNSNNDIFVLKLSSSGAYRWHTFYGSTDNDYATGIALDSSGNIFVTGNSSETWNGPNSETPLHGFNDASDFVVLKMSQNCLESPVKIESGSVYGSFSAAYSAAVTGDTILMQSMLFETALNLTRSVSVILKGGYYECDFSASGGFTTLPGLTIKGGTVYIDKLIIR